MLKIVPFLVAIFSLLGSLATAEASELSSVEASHSVVRIYAEDTAVTPGGTHWLAVTFEPREGWHTYWENPGDSGAAPDLSWSTPEGVTVGAPLFGVPEALPYGPLLNYGYKGMSTLLYPLTVSDTYAGSSPLQISTDGEWLVCEVECIPQLGTFTLDLPVGDGVKDAESSAIFLDARAALPDAPFWDAELRLTTEISRLIVFMTQVEAESVTAVRYFPRAEGVTEYAAEQRFFASEEGLFIDLPRYKGSAAPETGDGILVLTQDGLDLAVQVKAKAMDSAAVAARVEGADPAAAPQSTIPVWQAAIFAFLGGIILNLMPCVFPVLSLKALSFVRAGDGNQAAMRREGWAYTAGIVASFAVIVSVLVALRSGGAAIGWGFQLQEPVFVAVLVIIMVLVGLSMSGMFEFSTGFEGAGQSLTSQDGTRGAFFTGVLATLVATPCTAPLMAPAIGFALAQPAAVIGLVFLMLALGLAFPFLLLSYSPAIARLMPRPGPWMEKVKQGLAFPMYATAVWLLSVFGAQTGTFGITVLLGALVLIVFGIWLFKSGSRISKTLGVATALIAIVAFVRFDLGPAQPPETDLVADNSWSSEKVDSLRAEGTPVFAYFTADWCITCKVNERVALFRDETTTLFADKGVTVLKGDWTNKNAAIAKVLADHGRAGVPLYLYYAPGADAPVILPEILTPGVIRDALS